MKKITVLGSGGFGISLGVMWNKDGNEVTLWSAFQSEIDDIISGGNRSPKLPDIVIPKEVHLTSNLEECVPNADILVFCIPSKFIRDVAKKVAPYASDQLIINTGKGLEDHTFKRPSEVLEEELGRTITVLSGPSHAEEVALSMPTTVTASSTDINFANKAQKLLSNKDFRIYTNSDVIGCELGGALKNIIALSAGICDGLGFGDNTKAALMTRGLSEIAGLGVKMGANISTFAGLTGIGDLIVTCTSMHSRNRRCGILIGEGKSPQEAVDEVGTVEGFICTKVAYELSCSLGVDMPIVGSMYRILYENVSPNECLADLMGRPHKNEVEENVF
jgi:glycerol-3-phosphate dehydrogenase (NAD(P)+)